MHAARCRRHKQSCSTSRIRRCTTLQPEHACTTSVQSSASPAHPCSPTNTLPWNVAGHLLPCAAQCSRPSGATCGPSACTGCGATAAGVASWVGFGSGRLGRVGPPGRASRTAASAPVASRIPHVQCAAAGLRQWDAAGAPALPPALHTCALLGQHCIIRAGLPVCHHARQGELGVRDGLARASIPHLRLPLAQPASGAGKIDSWASDSGPWLHAHERTQDCNRASPPLQQSLATCRSHQWQKGQVKFMPGPLTAASTSSGCRRGSRHRGERVG